MTSDYGAPGFAAKASKLGRFLPDGKQADFARLLKETEQALTGLEAERVRLDQRLRGQTEETDRLRRRLRRLAKQYDRLQGIFQANARAFQTFRTAGTLSRGLCGLHELPALLPRLAQTLDVAFLSCLVCQEDFGNLVPATLARRSRQDLESALAALPRGEAGRSTFLGAVATLPQPHFFLETDGQPLPPQVVGGSCCIVPLRDKYDPRRLIGALVLADPDPTRYAPEKGSDFLDHFCELLAGDIQHVKIHDQLLRERESDELTGIANRVFLSRHGPPLLALAARKGSPVTMLFCDLDRFKAINDTYGHAVGDSVLIAVAQAMAATIRPYDLLARLGGDEFVLLLPDTGSAQARALADRIRQAVAATTTVAGLRLSVSIGQAEQIPGHDIDDLIRRADMAMYGDKHS